MHHVQEAHSTHPKALDLQFSRSSMIDDWLRVYTLSHIYDIYIHDIYVVTNTWRNVILLLSSAAILPMSFFLTELSRKTSVPRQVEQVSTTRTTSGPLTDLQPCNGRPLQQR